MIRTKDLFDLSCTAAAPLLNDTEYPWQALPRITEFILTLGSTLSSDEYEQRGENIWVSRKAKIAPTAYIGGPAIIMEGAELRHCAFVRGSALIGKGATLGNSCEVKNAILFDGAEVPHFNYIGDSVLGHRAHFGAGSITSNIKSDRRNIIIHTESERMETGMRKIGALVGDFVEVGCNAVLCPGTVVGRNSVIYPLVRVRGVIPENSIVKAPDIIVPKEAR